MSMQSGREIQLFYLNLLVDRVFDTWGNYGKTD